MRPVAVEVRCCVCGRPGSALRALANVPSGGDPAAILYPQPSREETYLLEGWAWLEAPTARLPTCGANCHARAQAVLRARLDHDLRRQTAWATWEREHPNDAAAQQRAWNAWIVLNPAPPYLFVPPASPAPPVPDWQPTIEGFAALGLRAYVVHAYPQRGQYIALEPLTMKGAADVLEAFAALDRERVRSAAS